MGDWGMILCQTQEQAEHFNSLRQYGWKTERKSLIPGFNSPLDELQAAILRVKLKHLNSDNAKRRQLADLYDGGLKDLPITLPYRNPMEIHAMHLYVIEREGRDGLMKNLRENEIGPILHYPIPVYQHRTYSGRLKGHDDLPHTEALYRRNLTLPLFPELPEESVARITGHIREWFLKS